MKLKLIFICLFVISSKLFAQDYTTSIVFPANYQVGDYVEFLGVAPIDAGSSGYYQISLSYTRGNIAAAASHLASISHANPAVWREVGRVNGNPYTGAGIYNFTIDCNTQYGNARFRVRAINTYGVSTPIAVNITVHSINNNSSWTALSNTGNDLTVTSFLPMTDEWSLYTGNDFSAAGANLAIKAVENGNVGIGTPTPDAKLTVNGTIHSKAVIVDLNIFPDYVFNKDYVLPTLTEIKTYIDENHHLPEMPSAAEVKKDGLNLGEINSLLTKKVEELTLYLIEKDKQIKNISADKKEQQEINKSQQLQINELKVQLNALVEALNKN